MRHAPESFFLDPIEEPHNILEGAIEWSAFVGSRVEVKLRIGETSLLIDAPTNREYIAGETLKVYVSKDKTIVLPWTGKS